MGSTSFLKPRSMYRTKSGSSAGSDKEMNAKLKRSKIRRPAKMNDYGIKRIPDYTEMAYKEAVSKLKYFLSGNNPPSVRSYGGSASIKNLDESDGDLDKKYSTSYNISEYKPRPRLAAKYATMYADSLNNYNPPQPPINTANVAQDVGGNTNPDVVNFIQKQEEYIEQLERESQYCRDELNNLLGKVKEVISENEHLHEAQKNKIISRMFHSYAGSETDDLDDVGDSTGLDSDCKISPSKTRKARSRTTKLEGPNIVFESRISELEAQLTQSKIDLKKLQDENNEYKRKLANGLVDSTCLDGFKRQIDNLQRDKTTLESQISKLKLNLEQKEGDFDSKYKKGSDVVEQQLREERNNLETEIRRLKDELSTERAKNRSLAGEGARRAVAERSAAEQRYHQHCDELQRDLAVQYDYVAKLQLDLERQRREENDLKREISMKNTAVEELKMELKNKTASLQADLAQAHAEKAALEEELASARLAMERHQRQSKHEANRLNSEIQSLRQRLDRADADLVHSRRENLRLSEQISNLEKELNMKNLTPISPEKKGKEKELSTMLESMENKHAKTVAELESMIQSQNSLMEKLTSECRLLTDKLDDSNRRHKEELATLQRQVENLGRSMQTPHPPSNYQAPSSHAPITTRISNIPTDAGPEHTRGESARDTTLGQHDDNSGNIDSYQDRDINIQEHKPDSSNLDVETPNISMEPEKKFTKQVSRDLIDNNQTLEPTKDIAPEEIAIEHVEITREKEIHKEYDDSKQNDKQDKKEEKDYAETDNSAEKLPKQYENQNYTEQDYSNYEQNYEQQYSEQPQYTEQQEYSEQPAFTEQQEYTETPEYTAQEYAEQPEYTEQYENYEQYPQQYTDPNTQYEGQEGYENYATDGNYREQNYENQQVSGDYAPQLPDAVTEQTESQESKTPNEKLTNQS